MEEKGQEPGPVLVQHHRISRESKTKNHQLKKYNRRKPRSCHKRATYGDVVLDTVRPVLGRGELPRHGHGDPVMHRPGQSDHPSHRVVLRQRRVDDVVTATTDHTVAPAGGQDVPVERDNHPHATNVVPVRPVGVWGSLKAVDMLKKK